MTKKSNETLKSVNAQVLQQTLKTLDRAFCDMKSKGFGFPRFSKKIRSFVFPQMLKNCLAQGKVKLPQLGWLKIKQSRDYQRGLSAKQARIVKKASGYYLMITFKCQELCPSAPVGINSLGIDAGIESFIATDKGELIKAPKFLLKAQSKLKLLQRRLKHKKKGSNNWLKLQNKIAKIHEKVANTRRDWHFKLAHYLCDLTDNIFVEDINFVSWSRGIVRKAEKAINRANRKKSQKFVKGKKPQSNNYHKARVRYVRKNLKVSRQRKEYAKRVAYCVIQSND